MNTPSLQGIRVLDFSSLLPGPFATLMMAEAGADVLKIERPGKGDEMRGSETDFALLNRGKRSLVLDLKSPTDRARLQPLVQTADILVEQFRPGVMERLGLDYEAVSHVNPGLIYCSISGYGANGPDALKVGHDLTYAAEAGVLAQTSAADGVPGMPPTLTADIGGGAYPAFMNIVLALFQRTRSGRGCHIEVSMFDNLFPFLQHCFAAAYGRGHWPLPNDALETGASPRYRIYATGDGRFLAVAPGEDRFWQNFCEAIHLPAQFIDDRCDPAATAAAVAAVIRGRTAAEWEETFRGRDVACAAVRTFEEAVHSPQFVSRDLLRRRVAGIDRSLPALPLPLAERFRDAVVSRAAPALGDSAARWLIARPPAAEK
jgi:alpha-methylacyl-CoA racemase